MTYLTIDEAAVVLRLTPQALRKRCARGARRVGRDTMTQLGDGVVAVKFGRSWRVKMDRSREAS
jgi:hypothetical protein